MNDVPPRLLRETLRDELARPSSRPLTPGCLDADVLAAWCDGTLNRRDRAAAESHAASCARCQAMLAAMAKTAEPVPARKWWQASTVRWLVPIAATAALAVVVWVKSPGERQAASIPPAAFVSAPVSATRSTDSPPPGAVAAGSPQSLSEAKATERPKAESRQRAMPVESGPERAAETAPPVVQPQGADAQTFEARDAAGARNVSAAPAPTATRVDVQSAAAPRTVAESVVIVPPQTFAAKARTLPLLAIASPNRDVIWRLVAGTSIERSTDGGATWHAQSTGVTGRLTAGVAPSSSVCWVVGSGGIVVVSRDGQTWQRIPFPEAIDLTAIVATDGSNATVTTADGRMFNTTDGGKTWRHE
jgi:hypothetical protein